MAIPTADCASEIDADVCCDTIWLIGDRIRTVAASGLWSCTADGCGQREFRSYSTWGERLEEPLGETLVVAWQQARAVAVSDFGALSPLGVTRLTYLIELRETGWPTVVEQSGQIILPDGAVLDVVSRHAADHAERVWRSVVAAAQTPTGANALFALPENDHIIAKSVTVSDMTPIGPEGPQVGARFRVSVDARLR